jgi:hypothetical protein
LNALDYAKERKQGPNFRFAKDPTKPRVAIIEHADVRRMLLHMKAVVEGTRALAVKLGSHMDHAKLSKDNEERATYHKGQVELLTPLLKAYATDQAFRVCELAIQTYGGAGYLKDHPVEQYCRDSKIFSIYEGTNHIQSMDLVGRKLGQANGLFLKQFLGDVVGFVEKHRSHPALGKDVEHLSRAQEALQQASMKLYGWAQGPKVELIPRNANRFLEMMSELAVGWLLLDAAVIADAARQKVSESHPDRAFYEGKVWTARYYARNVLPTVESAGAMLALEDTSPLEMPLEAFASE